MLYICDLTGTSWSEGRAQYLVDPSRVTTPMLQTRKPTPREIEGLAEGPQLLPLLCPSAESGAVLPHSPPSPPPPASASLGPAPGVSEVLSHPSRGEIELSRRWHLCGLRRPRPWPLLYPGPCEPHWTGRPGAAPGAPLGPGISGAET